jgi:ribosomal protein S18 acetylase RimI-like enzyme
MGEIEPIGIVPLHQGQGFGRLLLLLAIHRLAEGGHNAVKIGLWASNYVALHLYHSVGFRPVGRRYYLARDL